jgi:hypothetical protein
LTVGAQSCRQTGGSTGRPADKVSIGVVVGLWFLAGAFAPETLQASARQQAVGSGGLCVGCGCDGCGVMWAGKVYDDSSQLGSWIGGRLPA